MARRKRSLWLRYLRNLRTHRSTFVNTILVSFVFTGIVIVLVVHGINDSTAEALRGLQEKARKRPAWADYKSYPLINSYFNPLFNLVNRTENNPEWPIVAGKTPSSPDATNKNPFPKSHAYDPSDEFSSNRVECSWDDDDSGVTRVKPVMRRFQGVPAGFPDPVFGSYEALGWDANVCYDKFGRYGPYGYGYKEADGGLSIGLPILDMRKRRVREESEGGFYVGSMPLQKIDWRGVDWGKLQERCFAKNAHRFWQPKDSNGKLIKVEQGKKIYGIAEHDQVEPSEKELKGKKTRTAILVRTWHDYKYTKNDILNLRSLISEASLASGGEYTVHLLVHVKDETLPIWSDPSTYTRVITDSVPKEFRGLATLWNERLSILSYPSLQNDASALPIHGVYRSTFMPLQLFSLHNPQYTHLFNHELDVRVLSHHLSLLRSTLSFATAAPRLHLWERSQNYYIPTLHGSYAGFSQMIARTHPKPILGPVPVKGIAPIGPTPPFGAALSQWGIGEAPDLLTFNPFFDPSRTTWNLRHLTTAYPKGTPQLTSIITHSLLSRRLLRQMHLANVAGRTSFSESLPVSTALHHGLKAVFVPHPVYFDRAWKSGAEVDETFNDETEAGLDRLKEGGKDVYGRGEWVHKGGSWYAGGEFGKRLYKRWWSGRIGAPGSGESRMCLPGVMVHPVKGV